MASKKRMKKKDRELEYWWRASAGCVVVVVVVVVGKKFVYYCMQHDANETEITRSGGAYACANEVVEWELAAIAPYVVLLEENLQEAVQQQEVHDANCPLYET
jgi:hypothetical protein